MHAYSTPMTPAPTINIRFGSRERPRIVLESNTRRSSNGMTGGRTGSVPTAMTIRSVVNTWLPVEVATEIERSETNEASPRINVMPFRAICSRTTLVSVATIAAV